MRFEQDPVYLDYAATTPLDTRVAERMREVQLRNFANPASNHRLGWRSAEVIETAAQQLGGLLNVAATSFLWTSGATESNNLAIFGAARQRAHRGKHLITMRTEHKAVVDVFVALQKEGFDVTWLKPDASGRLAVDDFTAALRDDTQLASIMHINNETGAIQDVAALGAACRERGVLFHVDGAQSVGKVGLDLATLPIDLLSLTAHKFYGPSGIGALYVADGTHLTPLLFGGGQQRRLRPGTLPTDLIAGLGQAAEVAAGSLCDELQHLTELRDALWRQLRNIEGVTVNGDPGRDHPGILNVSIDDVQEESLLLALEPLCVATGSACNAQTQEPSAVLRSMGRSDSDAMSAIRFSFGRQTTVDEIEFAAAHYERAITKLRRLAA